MVESNFMDNVIPNDSLSDEEHRAICIKSPEKVAWFRIKLGDIILFAILLPNLLRKLFLRQIPTDNISPAGTNIGELG
jgi:hypothetical protein